jgi:GT2 family glycosyltransferase
MLAIIIVNYKNEKKTIDYIKNEVCKVVVPHIVVVVNNSATEQSNHELCVALDVELIFDTSQTINKKSKYFVIAHSDNLGFAKGNNLGADFCYKHFDVDYFLFSNNDILFTDDNVVEELIKKMESNREIGMIGPNIVGHDGERQSPFPYASFWDRYFWMYWLTPFMSKKFKNKIFQLNYSDEAKEGYHYRIMGSFFMVRSIDFKNCGMMDPNTFLFGEEMILTERLYRVNKKVYYLPSVSVLHDHNQTISKFIDQKRQYKIRFVSESYYYQEYRKVGNLSLLIGKFSYYLYLNLISFIKI